MGEWTLKSLSANTLLEYQKHHLENLQQSVIAETKRSSYAIISETICKVLKSNWNVHGPSKHRELVELVLDNLRDRTDSQNHSVLSKSRAVATVVEQQIEKSKVFLNIA